MVLEYRTSDYFNKNEVYILETGLDKLYVSSVHFYNSAWYADSGEKYKMTTVKCINAKELYGKEVQLEGLDYTGKIIKFLTSPYNDLGIQWNSGEQIKKHGLASFWQNINNIKII